MDGLPKCRLIIGWGAGYDVIDAGAAMKDEWQGQNVP
jgi:hypothetical protein